MQTHDLDYFTVSWTAPAVTGDILGYIIQYTVAGIPKTGTQSPDLTSITFQDSDLQGGEPQDVLVAPFSATGVGDVVQAQAPTQAGKAIIIG